VQVAAIATGPATCRMSRLIRCCLSMSSGCGNIEADAEVSMPAAYRRRV
jgi:hypothetical protein